MNIRDPQTYQVIGAAMEVHRALGCGFLEAVYQEALAAEFDSQGIPFMREVELKIFYKDVPLRTFYKADFICFDDPRVLVEIKAIKILTEIEEAQLLNYLKATRIKTGLLINFGAKSLEHKRFKN